LENKITKCFLKVIGPLDYVLIVIINHKSFFYEDYKKCGWIPSKKKMWLDKQHV